MISAADIGFERWFDAWRTGDERLERALRLRLLSSACSCLTNSAISNAAPCSPASADTPASSASRGF